MREYGLGQRPADPLDPGQIRRRGMGDRVYPLEVTEQSGFSCLSNAGDGVEFRMGQPFLSQLAVIGYGPSVGLIPDPHHKQEHWIFTTECQWIFPIG